MSLAEGTMDYRLNVPHIQDKDPGCFNILEVIDFFKSELCTNTFCNTVKTP
jgi:hypothetical protein